MSFRLRVALVVAAASGLLVLLSGLVFVHQLETGLLASVDAGLRSRADALAQRLGPDGSGDFQDSGAEALLTTPCVKARLKGPKRATTGPPQPPRWPSAMKKKPASPSARPE